MEEQSSVPDAVGRKGSIEKEWPNLFEETYDMLKVSTMMYFLSSMRDLARENLKSNEELTSSKYDTILKLPITLKDIICAMEEDADELEKKQGCALFGTERVKRCDLNRNMMRSLLLRDEGLVFGENFDDGEDDEPRKIKTILKGTFDDKDVNISYNNERVDFNNTHDEEMGVVNCAEDNEAETPAIAAKSKDEQNRRASMILFEEIYGHMFKDDKTGSTTSEKSKWSHRQSSSRKSAFRMKENITAMYSLVDDILSTSTANNWEVIEFDDENSNKEIVYSIMVDHFRKEVIVAFRGSVTLNDWMYNSLNFRGVIPNPVPDELINEMTNENDSSKLRQHAKHLNIHLGFEYYLRNKSLSEAEKNGEQTLHDYENPYHESLEGSKLLKIYFKTRATMDKYPDYRLYITGHSLGGSLSKILAFHLAADVSIKQKPVTCIAIAAPKIGTLSTRLTFELLEKAGLLRCLQVSNEDDIIPELPQNPLNPVMCPTTLPFWTKSFEQSTTFRDTGIKLFLHKEDAGYTLYYPKVGTNYYTQLWDDWQYIFRGGIKVWKGAFCCARNELICRYRKKYYNQVTYAECHGVTEYLFRLKRIRSDLEKERLNTLYSDIADTDAPHLRCCSLSQRPRLRTENGESYYGDGVIVHNY